MEEDIGNLSDFMVGLSKRLSWSVYVPVRLSVKRKDYVKTIYIPRKSDHLVSGALTTIGAVTTKFIGIGFRKGTGGGIIFKDCPLFMAKIVDFDMTSSVEVFFPMIERYANGIFNKGYEIVVKAKVKGFIWKNRKLLGVEVRQYGGKNELLTLLRNEELMKLYHEYFSLMVYWTGFGEIKEISLKVKDIGDKRMSTLLFTLFRPNKGALNFLSQRNQDIQFMPEILFDTSKKIAELLEEVKT